MVHLNLKKNTAPNFRRRTLSPKRETALTGVWRILIRFAFGGILLWGLAGAAAAKEHYLIPPLEVDIVDFEEKPKGRALLYPGYIELTDADGNLKGKIGVVFVQGKAQLYLIRANEERKFIGWAQNFRLFNSEDKLVGFYFWSPIWSFVYDAKMKHVGKAQCIAYQGLCAAGVAGFLLGLY